MSRTQSAFPFVVIEDADWNRDDAVLRHEVAHALVWFHHGGGIGRLRAVRQADGLMLASVKTGPRPDQNDTPDFVDGVAERLLAGEVASRIHSRLPNNRIALRRFSGNTLPKGITAKELAETATENLVAPGGQQMLEDITKVLLMAHDYHPELRRSPEMTRLCS